jgi:Kelch motif protein
MRVNPLLGLCLWTFGCNAILGLDDPILIKTGTPQLIALEPSLANSNDTIMLEGTFAPSALVNFPGGVSSPATVLGAHRAMVTVPVIASAGDLTVTTDGVTVGPLPFRRASFALGAQSFAGDYGSALVVARYGHTTVVVGNFLYAVGGLGTSGYLDSLERALINADGSIGNFVTVPGVTLATGRAYHTSLVVGGFLYVLGGTGASGRLGDVERATINPDGSLGIFAGVPAVVLATPREFHTAAVVGNSLYVLGGNGDAGTLNGIERATIAPDGSLGAFAPVPGETLATARARHSSVVLGNWLYVFGGRNSSGDLDTVERASIQPDGSLAPFAPVSGVTLQIARSAHTSVAVGNSLYIVGGQGGGAPLGSVERANISATGSLGPFSVTADPVLTIPRAGHTSATLGNVLYVIGGLGNSSEILNRIDGASVNADGAVAAFSAIAGLTLGIPRAFHQSAVLGNSLYVFGGTGVAGDSPTVERALIKPDGSLGQFSLVSGVMLDTARDSYASVAVGNYVYALGGTNTGTSGLKSVERAPVNPDGTLGAFVPVGTLVVGRIAPTAVVAGDSVYVIGGTDGSMLQGSVERATMNSDGSLNAFTIVSGVALITPRYYHGSMVVGNSVYVIGGFNTTRLASVERAVIKPDGSLGAFATVSGVALQTARDTPTIALVGSSLYVLGGNTTTPGTGGVLDSVERAPINADGSLGPFETVSVRLASVRVGNTTAVVGNTLYVVGGTTFIAGPGQFPASVEQANLP